MLTLTRRVGERIYIGNDVVIEVISTGANHTRIGVRALRSVPIVRGELIEQVQQANRSAVNSPAAAAVERRNDALHFPRGLLGFESLKRWVLCDLDDAPPGTEAIGLRVLVAQDDPSIRLLVGDLEMIAPQYPFELALTESGTTDEAAVFAGVINVVPGGGATINLVAPLVIGVETREGAQVVLTRKDLAVDARLDDVVGIAAGEAHP